MLIPVSRAIRCKALLISEQQGIHRVVHLQNKSG
jgi:hypothetical protein